MLSNLKKINNEFDKKIGAILDNISFENFKNLFRKKKKEVKEKPEKKEKQYIDFPITVSQEVVDLKKRLEEAMNKEPVNQESKENTESNNDEKKLLLLDFLRKNIGEDLRIPKNSEILNSMDISEWELRVFKNQLVEDGHLEKINERVYALKD